MGKAEALSDLEIRRLHKAGKPTNAIADGGGLYFRIHDSGAAQWYFRYSAAGKARWVRLARYPDVGLAAARKLAREARVQRDRGVDVAAERIKQKFASAHTVTVATVADEWLSREIEKRVKHPEVVRRVIENDVVKVIGGLPIDQVTGLHVDRVLQKIVAREAPTTANDALRYLRRMFAFARKRHYLTYNPAADFTVGDAGGSERARDRALSIDELTALFKKIRETPNFGRPNELALKVLLATCVRKRELVAAPKAEFDLAKAIWNLPANRTKTGAALQVPLAPCVVEWLRELMKLAGDDTYLLPARRISAKKRFPHVSPDTLNVALGRLEHDLEHFTVHDMRRTARTHMSALGIEGRVAERALNHKLKGVEGIYDRHDFFKERRQALALWASVLEAAERGKKVVAGRFGGRAA